MGGVGQRGFPISDEVGLAGGVVQTTERGRLYWSPDAGAHWAHGAILGTYLWWGGPAGPLGFPVSQEEDADGEVVQYFEYGEIWWHPVDGATIDIY